MSVSVEQYAHPDVLVDTQWVLEHHKDGNVRIAEVDYDPAANYVTGHIPGAVLFDWKKDINDQGPRDILTREQLVELFSRTGISNEEDRPVDKTVPNYPRANFKAPKPDESLRVFKDHVIDAVKKRDKILIDVRSAKEFTGEILAPPEYPTEHAQRGGHIPSALNIPWAQAVNDADGTFKSKKDLETLYGSKGVTPKKEVITYCRIGERSSHTWFVLKYLLGYPKVKNYDGSWTEWGNSVRLPIEK
ncbi:MAG: sulfurtransferase [Thaumarchaeota archaeon]|nr:sulfurtransferase [Nitrososphaerota archaeon]